MIMKHYNTIVIGGGILGCFAARNLRKWNISTLLLEASDDVCTGITKANAGIVYTGYDNKPGSLKTQMTTSSNKNFGVLCEMLDVPFYRCGSLMVSYDSQADEVIRKKYNLSGLRLLSGHEAEELEPTLASGITSALFSPDTGTVNPWQLGIAAFENALHNDAQVQFRTAVMDIRQAKEGYILETEKDSFSCDSILNCAGLQADKIQELLFPPHVRIRYDASDFLMLNKYCEKPEHIIFFESGEKGKGITAVPTTDGNLLLESSKRNFNGKFWATTPEGIEQLKHSAQKFFPNLDTKQMLRSFAAVRPNPYYVDLHDNNMSPNKKNIPDFAIEQPAPNFYSLIGIKTPGLTCADALGQYLAEKIAAYLQAEKNTAFDPYRKLHIPKDYEIICQCNQVSKAEILDAIKRGAVTADGVKRRVESGLGLCQGSRCTRKIEQLLEEYVNGSL